VDFIKVMNDDNKLAKVTGKGIILHRYGTKTPTILATSVGAGLFSLLLLAPFNGGLLTKLIVAAGVGEATLLVSAYRDPNRPHTF
jgi:hypothetical protein